MKKFIKNRLNVLLTEGKEEQSQYQMRDIGGVNVYYRKKKKDKHWVFIDEKEFDEKANKENTIKCKDKKVN